MLSVFVPAPPIIRGTPDEYQPDDPNLPRNRVLTRGTIAQIQEFKKKEDEGKTTQFPTKHSFCLLAKNFGTRVFLGIF